MLLVIICILVVFIVLTLLIMWAIIRSIDFDAEEQYQSMDTTESKAYNQVLAESFKPGQL